MPNRVATVTALVLAGTALASCAPPYACPPGYHLGPYGRRCWPDAGYYPPPPGQPPPPPGAYGPPSGGPHDHLPADYPCPRRTRKLRGPPRCRLMHSYHHHQELSDTPDCAPNRCRFLKAVSFLESGLTKFLGIRGLDDAVFRIPRDTTSPMRVAGRPAPCA